MRVSILSSIRWRQRRQCFDFVGPYRIAAIFLCMFTIGLLFVIAALLAAIAVLATDDDECDDDKWESNHSSHGGVPVPVCLAHKWLVPLRVLASTMHFVAKSCLAGTCIGRCSHHEDEFGGDGGAVRRANYRSRVSFDKSCGVLAVSSLVDVSLYPGHFFNTQLNIRFCIIAILIVLDANDPVTGLVCQCCTLLNHHTICLMDLISRISFKLIAC